MTDIRIVMAWLALACCVTMIGRMTGRECILGVGAIMVLFTCAFAC